MLGWKRRRPRIKVIKNPVRQIDLPDDTSYPFKLVVVFTAPEKGMGYVLYHGTTEQFVVRGNTPHALARFVRKNKFEADPRFRSWEITGPSGKVVWSVRMP